MAFIDEIQFHIKAGKGGNGVVRWRHEKGKEFSGAAGGNGGRGGDVYARAVRDIGILASYRNVKEFKAGNGEDGMRNSMHGKDGEDLIINFPVGSVITNQSTGKTIELLKEGEQVKLLSGGRGGLGNEHFKASTNVTPYQSTPGKDGEEADFDLELRLVVDAGLIGLPNAGKSSLLNELTNASAKVGSYAFTTLEPNLGDFYGFILADIPGLIEGASEGKGLGHKFLRHIQRTKTLIHCVSMENEDLAGAYKTVREELAAYDTELAKKPEIIVLTKTDATTPQAVKKAITLFKKKADTVFAVSILDDELLKTFREQLLAAIKRA